METIMALTVHKIDDAGLIEVQVSGKLTAEDYHEFVPEIETAIDRLGLFNQPVLPGLTHTICPACMTLRYGDDD